MQAIYEDVKQLNGEIGIFSAETAKISADLARKQNLNYLVVQDDGLDISRSFGLAFMLPDDPKGVYSGFGIDLPKTLVELFGNYRCRRDLSSIKKALSALSILIRIIRIDRTQRQRWKSCAVSDRCRHCWHLIGCRRLHALQQSPVSCDIRLNTAQTKATPETCLIC